MTQTSRSVALNWREAGPSTGPVLLLVHGFPFNSAMWRPQLDSPPAGWRVVAPDLRGFGQSPPLDGEPLTMDVMADDVAGLLQQIGAANAVVCGLSMGGYIAFALLRRHPGVFRGLILCDTRPEADTEEVRRGRLQSAARVAAEGTASVVDGMLPKVLAPVTPYSQPELMREVRELMASAPPASVAAALRAMAARPDSSPMLRNIMVPTQIIVGADDQITPAGEAQLLTRAIPGASLSIIRDAGHVPNLENPAAFNAVLETFLSIMA